MLPENTILGRLRIIEVYEYYDRPILFACQNQLRNIFLVVWADEDDNGETWFYLPMSPLRYQLVRAGNIDLHTAFVESEEGIVYSLYAPFEMNGRTRVPVEILNSSSISDDYLPEKGEALNIMDPTPKLRDILRITLSSVNVVTREFEGLSWLDVRKYPTLQLDASSPKSQSKKESSQITVKPPRKLHFLQLKTS